MNRGQGGATGDARSAAPRRALIVAPATVTDVVLSQPLVALLRGFDPAGTIDVLTSPGLAPLYRSMPAIDDIIETAIAPQSLALARRLALARAIDAKAYDRAYILQDGRIAAIAPWLARIPHRFGMAAGNALGLINRPRGGGVRTGQSISDCFAALAFDFGQPLPPGLPAPELEDPPVLGDALAQRLGLDRDQTLILLCPASELGPASEWPARHYAALAAMMAARWPDAMIGLIGRSRDRSLTTRIAATSGQMTGNWAGQLTLAETMALIGHASALVSSESSTMHLAAALGRPHVAIYGAGDPRSERINGNRRSVMWLHLECGPCLDAHCRFGHTDCVARQSPQAVFTALQKTMRFSATI